MQEYEYVVIKEEIAKKLRGLVKEFGQSHVQDVVLIGPNDFGEFCCGHRYVHSPTAAGFTLGKCSWKVARYFEDFYG